MNHVRARKGVLAVVTAVGMIAAMAGCAASGAQEGSPAKQKVLIYASPVPHDAAVFVAQEQGFFAKNGLDVQIQSFPSGTTALETFKQGIDGKAGFGDLIVSGGFPALSFWDKTDGKYQALAAVEQDSKGYVAMARADIKTPADLRGKTIGYRKGSTSELFARTYLQKNGLSFDKDVKAVNLDQAAMISALDRGDIDAFFLFEPAGRLAVAASGDKVHYLSTGEGYLQGTTVVGTWSRTIKSDPAMLKKVLTSIIQGEDYANAHPDDVAALYKKKFNIAVDGTLADLKVLTLHTSVDDSFVEASKTQAAVLTEWGSMTRPFDMWSFTDACVLKGVASDRVVAEGPKC